MLVSAAKEASLYIELSATIRRKASPALAGRAAVPAGPIKEVGRLLFICIFIGVFVFVSLCIFSLPRSHAWGCMVFRARISLWVKLRAPLPLIQKCLYVWVTCVRMYTYIVRNT